MECTTACYEFVRHSKRAVEILQQVIATAEKRLVRRHGGGSSRLRHSHLPPRGTFIQLQRFPAYEQSQWTVRTRD